MPILLHNVNDIALLSNLTTGDQSCPQPNQVGQAWPYLKPLNPCLNLTEVMQMLCIRKGNTGLKHLCVSHYIKGGLSMSVCIYIYIYIQIYIYIYGRKKLNPSCHRRHRRCHFFACFYEKIRSLKFCVVVYQSLLQIYSND